MVFTSRKLSSPQHLLSLDVSSGILVPLFDPDTNMVFLSGKGDRYSSWYHYVMVNISAPLFDMVFLSGKGIVFWWC